MQLFSGSTKRKTKNIHLLSVLQKEINNFEDITLL